MLVVVVLGTAFRTCAMLFNFVVVVMMFDGSYICEHA
jgi:hypothetical protein